MDDRIHDALHTMATSTQKVHDAVRAWEEDVTQFYILVEQICKEKEKKDG